MFFGAVAEVCGRDPLGGSFPDFFLFAMLSGAYRWRRFNRRVAAGTISGDWQLLQPVGDLAEDPLGVFVGDLTGTGVAMAAPAVFEHDLADVVP